MRKTARSTGTIIAAFPIRFSFAHVSHMFPTPALILNQAKLD
jgi:hypothetical protein